MEVNQEWRMAAGTAQSPDVGREAGASISNHQFRYGSMIRLRIVDMLPQTDLVPGGWICRSELAPLSSTLICVVSPRCSVCTPGHRTTTVLYLYVRTGSLAPELVGRLHATAGRNKRRGTRWLCALIRLAVALTHFLSQRINAKAAAGQG